MKLKFKEIPVRGYEKVVSITEPESGLKAIISIHDTTLGPALGGTRIYPYASFDDALEDVLRLSKGMTYKSAIVEAGFGGGKSVIIADPKVEKTPEMIDAFAKAVERLAGSYICAEDSGCTTADCMRIRETTRYVVGLPHEKSSGNPSPFTAWGTFRGMHAVAKTLFGKGSLEGKTVAIQGLGSVGSILAEYLFWVGANLIVADPDNEKVEECVLKYGAKAVDINEILFQECDILAPCALGGILNEKTIPQLRCKGIAGAANNQLKKASDGELLMKRGILYAPDFVINAGGLINVILELREEGYDPVLARKNTHAIYDVLMSIFDIAKQNRTTTNEAAISLADYRIQYGIGKRMIEPAFPNVETFANV